MVAERIVTLLDEVAADTPPEVLARLRDRVHADAASVRDVVDETLDSERYAAALVALDEVVAHPPYNDEAERRGRPLARDS